MSRRMFDILSGRDRSLLAQALRLGLSAFSPFYRLGVAVRNAAFDWGLRRAAELPRPVVSVGNLTAGGTGKTPLVIELARRLTRLGARPAVLLRGYRPSGASGDEPSDEATLLRQALGDDVPVEADPDRRAAARRVLDRHPQTTLFILDDGFQHRQVKRDLDLVLIDATLPFGGGRLLPAGLLREPVANLRRASAILITRADLAEPARLKWIEQCLEARRCPEPLVQLALSWTTLRDASDRERALDHLRDTPVAGVCGLGNPGQFKLMLRRAFPRVAGLYELDDHQSYTRGLVASIMGRAREAGASAIVTTDKDWVKWRTVAEGESGDLPVYRAELGLAVLRGERQLDGLLAAVASSGV